jgi:hypothetical protein
MASKINMLRRFLLPLGAAFLFGLTGCQQAADESAQVSEAQLQELQKRVEERWQARIAHDWGKAWEYSSPAYREVFPKHLYVKKFSYTADWELTGIEVTHYDPSAAVASVVVRVMSRPTKQTSAAAKALGAMPRNLHERWILIDGQWWFSANY